MIVFFFPLFFEVRFRGDFFVVFRVFAMAPS